MADEERKPKRLQVATMRPAPELARRPDRRILLA
jgi:hypothetical protein